MSTLSWILIGVIILEWFNVTTAYGVNIEKRGVRLLPIRDSENGEMTYLIGGLLSRTEHTFDFLLDSIPGGITYVEYKNAGLDPEQAATEIRMDMLKYRNVRVVSASLGYILAAKAVTGQMKTQMIALNPCTGYASVKRQIQGLKIALPLVRLLVLLLGWIAYLPLVKTANGQNYSLRLWLDQAKVCLGPTRLATTWDRRDLIVLSSDDEVLNNTMLRGQFYTHPSEIREIKGAKHADFTAHGADYLALIEPALAED